MRRITPQNIKNNNYLATQEKIHKDIYFNILFCMLKNYTSVLFSCIHIFFFVDFNLGVILNLLLSFSTVD